MIKYDTCNSYSMVMRDLTDMYVQSLKTTGPMIESIHIRQITVHMLQLLHVSSNINMLLLTELP